jgi:hypothetical protein
MGVPPPSDGWSVIGCARMYGGSAPQRRVECDRLCEDVIKYLIYGIIYLYYIVSDDRVFTTGYCRGGYSIDVDIGRV